MKKHISWGLFIMLFLCCFLTKASAATMSNDSYSIEKHEVKIEPFRKELPSHPKIQEEKPLAKGTNYLVETTSPDPFSFTLSQDVIDFGKLSATNPVIRDMSLNVLARGNYQIVVAEDHPLKMKTNATIPDTTCDNGSCSQMQEATWANTLTYGFGYQTDTMLDESYKQLADTSRNEFFQPAPEGKIIFKVNISGTQQPGNYENTVTFIATPDF